MLCAHFHHWAESSPYEPLGPTTGALCALLAGLLALDPVPPPAGGLGGWLATADSPHMGRAASVRKAARIATAPRRKRGRRFMLAPSPGLARAGCHAQPYGAPAIAGDRRKG